MAGKLNQVFLNLVINAAQAIEERGVIEIRTCRDGRHSVCVEIADTGKGIAPEQLPRIFDPFFTTKPIGKGTGLGLSIAYGIVQRHGGRIEVESAPGAGTRFRIRLPLAGPRPTDAAARRAGSDLPERPRDPARPSSRSSAVG
jgi:signal transduction histidine kinase